MLVENISVINKAICIENQSIALGEYGVYLLQGENGSGKTSLINKLVFDKNTIRFNSKNQENAYSKEREQLVSYLPQDIISYKCTIRDYVLKGRTDISDKEIQECFGQINAEELDLNMNFAFLSGGEKVKVALASLILKNTPYIFLDEPTNNLDNETVKDLSKFINEYAKTHTILIVSHDRRLELDTYKQINIQSNNIIQETQMDENKLNRNECSAVRVNKFKLFVCVCNSKIRWLSIFIMLFVLAEAVFFNDTNFQSKFSMDEFPEKNVIATYVADQVYDELNKVYCKGKDLQIKEEDYYTMIEYGDIPQIASMSEIESIIIYDEIYFEKIYALLSGEETTQEIIVMAPPERIIKDFGSLLGIGIDTDADNILLEGRYPKDRAREVAISKATLKEFYSYTDDMLYEAIGKEIEIYGESYTIVGIVASDICFLSFEENKNYGFYQYHPDTYSAFVDTSKAFREKEDWYLENEIEILFIYTKDGAEEHILDQLMQTYPANNYNSYIYSKIWEKTYNKPVLFESVNVNLFLFVIFACFIFVINKGILQMQMEKIKDYENYYIKNGMIRKSLLLSYVLEFIFVAAIVLLGNAVFSPFAYVSGNILLMDIIIIYIPIILYIMYWECSKKKM